jgi:hypothetical protein
MPGDAYRDRGGHRSAVMTSVGTTATMNTSQHCAPDHTARNADEIDGRLRSRYEAHRRSASLIKVGSSAAAPTWAVASSTAAVAVSRE